MLDRKYHVMLKEMPSEVLLELEQATLIEYYARLTDNRLSEYAAYLPSIWASFRQDMLKQYLVTAFCKSHNVVGTIMQSQYSVFKSSLTNSLHFVNPSDVDELAKIIWYGVGSTEIEPSEPTITHAEYVRGIKSVSNIPAKVAVK